MFNPKSMLSKAKVIAGTFIAMMAVPMAANAADYTYATGTTSETETTSNDWVQTGDNTWAMDVPDENGKTDGVYDVTLKSEINSKTGEQEWSYTFYVESNEKAYYVYEQMTKNGTAPLKDGYSSVGSEGSDETKVTALPEDPGVTKTKKYTIINSKDHEDVDVPKYGNLSIKKTVSNPGSMQNKNQEFSFTVTLTGDTDDLKEAISGTKVFGDTPFTDGVATVILKKDETVTITGIPAGVTYKVVETVPEEYSAPAKTGDAGTIEADTTSEAEFVNTTTHIDVERTYTSFTLGKTVVDPANLSSNADYTFHVLFEGLQPYDEITGTKTDKDSAATENTYTANEYGVLTVEATLKDKEQIVFSRIPEDATYMITENGGEYASSYQMMDEKIKISSGAAAIGESLTTQKKTALSDENIVITFTNTIERTQNIALKKVSLLSDGSSDEDDKTQYSIKAMFYGLTSGYKITTTSGILIADEDGEAETTFLVTAGQSITFQNVPVGATYQFTEEGNKKIASYEITGEGKKVVKETNANTTFDTDLATEIETVDANEEAVVTFTNTSPKITKIIVEKYDSNDKTKLKNAEFELYYENGNPVNFTTVDGVGSNVITVGLRGKSEELESDLFVAGKYYLIETVAPEGHLVNADPQPFEIKEEDLGTTITIKVYDDKILVFPNTGGEGRYFVYAIAAGLGIVCAISVMIAKRKKGKA